LQKNPIGQKWADRYLRQLYSELNSMIVIDRSDRGIGAGARKAAEPLTLIH
jgi:hypothetical protein